MNQPADDDMFGVRAARPIRLPGLVHGLGLLQVVLGCLAAASGLLPLPGLVLIYGVILPLGSTARLLACGGMWQAPRFWWFLSLAFLGPCAGVATFIVYDGMLQREVVRAEQSPWNRSGVDDAAVALGAEAEVFGEIVLALAALEGALCIWFAAAHSSIQPRHSGRVYVGGVLDIAVALVLMSTYGLSDNSMILPCRVAALLLGVSLVYGGRTFVMMASEALTQARSPGRATHSE